LKTADKPGQSSALRLEEALRLLQHGGVDLPTGGPADPAWLQGLIDALCDLSSRDALTGLSNRRAFQVSVAREIDRVARAGEPALLLVADIDHFKSVNDRHGHGAGDLVLRHVANVLKDSVRPMDTVARVGGEEFAMVLPNCSPAFGQAVAERIRRRIAERAVVLGPGLPDVAASISIGGAYAPQWVRSSAELWQERADAQLYRAKAQGRNRVCIEPTAVSVVSAEEKGLLFGTSQFQDLE
jgi:diguanylate cyclase (GGDEF)-like protein